MPVELRHLRYAIVADMLFISVPAFLVGEAVGQQAQGTVDDR